MGEREGGKDGMEEVYVGEGIPVNGGGRKVSEKQRLDRVGVVKCHNVIISFIISFICFQEAI